MTPRQIRAVRITLQLTQVQMAQLMNVHPVTMSKWESPDEEKYEPSAYHEALLDAFRDAVKNRPKIVPRMLARVLAARGVPAALYCVLSGAFGRTKL